MFAELSNSDSSPTRLGAYIGWASGFCHTQQLPLPLAVARQASSFRLKQPGIRAYAVGGSHFHFTTTSGRSQRLGFPLYILN